MSTTTEPQIDPYLTESDRIVLTDLHQDIKNCKTTPKDITTKQIADTTTAAAITHLKSLNDPSSPSFSPTIFVSWDTTSLPPFIQTNIIHPYARWATTVVRHPTDIVFLTHIILYFTVLLPSAIYLFHNFTYLHAIPHLIFTIWCAGGYTLMLHNHIHNNGVLSPAYKAFDFAFPYVLSPLLGHTWDSYYYHHVKHHHVEGNGPDDLSSTLRYQRDEVWDFAQYVGRFLFFVWLDLPLYFLRKGKYALAMRSFGSEMASFGYSDFDRLHTNLVRSFPHAANMIPDLPRKSVVSRFRPEFLESRRRGLQHFLNCILLNPEFASSPVLKEFVFS